MGSNVHQKMNCSFRKKVNERKSHLSEHAYKKTLIQSTIKRKLSPWKNLVQQFDVYDVKSAKQFKK